MPGLSHLTRAAVLKALAARGWVIKRTATDLGVHRNTLHNFIGNHRMKRPKGTPHWRVTNLGRAVVLDALAACDWVIGHAAHDLNIHRSTLHRFIKQHGLERPEGSPYYRHYNAEWEALAKAG